MWLKIKRKWKVLFKRDVKPASNRLQRFDHWATIFGLFVSIWFFYLTSRNTENIDELKIIAENQMTQNQRLEDLIVKNKIQTDTLVGIIRRLDSQNKNLNSILILNTKQFEIIKQQLSFTEKASSSFEQENMRKFEESSKKLRDLFPSQDFNNFYGQQQRYEEIRKEIRQVLKNPYTFGYNGFIHRSIFIESFAEHMKIHFYNRSVGEQGGICNNNTYQGFEYDNCIYDTFKKDYVAYLNSFNALMSLKNTQQIKKYLKIKGLKIDKYIEENEKRLQKELK